MKISLKNKITLSSVLVIFVFGAVAVNLVFLYTKKIFTENEERFIALTVEEQSRKLSQVFVQNEMFVKTFSRLDYMAEYLKNSPVQQDGYILNKLKEHNINDNYSAIYVMNEKGDVLVSTNKSLVGRNYAFGDYFKKTVLEKSRIDVSVCITDRKLGYYFAHSIDDENGDSLGVVVFKMRSNYVNDIIESSIGNNKEGRVMLVDEYGVVVESSDDTGLFMSLWDLSQPTLNKINEIKRFPGVVLGSMGYNMGRYNLPVGFDPVSSNVIGKDGKDKISLSSKVNDYPFYVIAEVDADIYVNRAFDIAIILSIIIILAVLLAATLVYFLVNHSLKPLVEMEKIVQKASLGDFGQRVVVSTSDEIGNLGRSFNNMIFKLQKSLESVEAEVEKRTRQLEKLNRSMVGRELKMIDLKKEIMELKNKFKNKSN